MRIFITGGAGCLGSNLIEHWVPEGHEILVLDNFITSKKEVLPDVTGLKVIEGDVSNFSILENCFDEFNPEIVIHSAASYKDPDDWQTDVGTNVNGSINIAKLSEKYSVNRLINFQTALCYGRPSEIPIPVCHPTAPFTSYGISKTAGEQYILNSELPSISLRIANVISPRLSIGPIPTFYKRLKAGQDCFCSDTSRDFLDIDDFFRFMDIAIQDRSPLGVYNISSGKDNSVKEIFDIVASHLNLGEIDVPIVQADKDDVKTVCLDPTETGIAFNWKAEVSFEESVIKLLKWYDNFGVSDVYSHLKSPKSTS